MFTFLFRDGSEGFMLVVRLNKKGIIKSNEIIVG